MSKAMRSDRPWLRRFPDPRPSPLGPDRGEDRTGARPGRMRILVAIPTSNQMYSGIGRAIVELTRRLHDRAAFTFALDDRDPRSLRRVWDFAAPLGIPMLVGPHHFDPDCLEPVNERLPEILSESRWDAVELVGFANAATGRAVLDHLDDRTALCYTPHDQPLWTVPMSPGQQANVAEIHRRVIGRADLVLADSPAENVGLRRLSPVGINVVTLPLGCDFDSFDLGPPDRPPRLLFVGDLAEIRKRFDRVIAVFEHVIRRRPDARLVVIGNRSDDAGDRIPPTLRHAVELRGYVSESQLKDAYTSSCALILLSDVEAFGLPILEALASGTPVLLGGLDTTRSLFGDCPGAHFCPLGDPGATDAVADRLMDDIPGAVAAARSDRERLRSVFDWDRLADRKWQLLKAAWARRNAWDWRTPEGTGPLGSPHRRRPPAAHSSSEGLPCR